MNEKIRNYEFLPEKAQYDKQRGYKIWLMIGMTKTRYYKEKIFTAGNASVHYSPTCIHFTTLLKLNLKAIDTP